MSLNKNERQAQEDLAAKLKELEENGVGSTAAEATETAEETQRPEPKRVANRTEIRDKAYADAEAEQERQKRPERGKSRGSSAFWPTVRLAEKVTLPKAHLTQPEVASEIEEAMAGLDNDKSRVEAFQKVVAGVFRGRSEDGEYPHPGYSQYAALLFGHFARTTVLDRKTRKVVKNKNGSVRTRNQIKEAIALQHVIDALIAEMPEGSEPRRLNDAYADVVEKLNEALKADGYTRDSAEANKAFKAELDKRLAEGILAAEKAGDPFWTDSREFIQDAVVEGSDLQLTDLIDAGAISVKETKGGENGRVSGGKYLAEAAEKLAEAGFEAAAELLRSRTEEKKAPRKSNKRADSPLKDLAKLSAKVADKSKAQAKDKPESKEAPASKKEEVAEAPAESDTQTEEAAKASEEVSQETDKS